MCDDSRCFYHDDKELFHRVRSTWTESPNTLDWESCVLKLRVRTRRTGSPGYLDWESGGSGLLPTTLMAYSFTPFNRVKNLIMRKTEMINP